MGSQGWESLSEGSRESRGISREQGNFKALSNALWRMLFIPIGGAWDGRAFHSVRTSAGHGNEETWGMIWEYMAWFVWFPGHLGSTGRLTGKMEWRLLCPRAHRKHWQSQNQNVNLLTPRSHQEAGWRNEATEIRTAVLGQEEEAKPETSPSGQIPVTQGRKRLRARENLERMKLRFLWEYSESEIVCLLWTAILYIMKWRPEVNLLFPGHMGGNFIWFQSYHCSHLFKFSLALYSHSGLYMVHIHRVCAQLCILHLVLYLHTYDSVYLMSLWAPWRWDHILFTRNQNYMGLWGTYYNYSFI